MRTELEERQADVMTRHISTSGMPRARVLPPPLRALHDELRSIEALETLVYDPAVWEPPSTMA